MQLLNKKLTFFKDSILSSFKNMFILEKEEKLSKGKKTKKEKAMERKKILQKIK